MKFYFLLLLSTFIYSKSTFAQEFLSYNKDSILTYFDTTKYKIIETESSLELEKIDDKVKLKYDFDNNNNCYAASLKFYSNKCTESYLSDALFDDGNEWIKIDSTTYISKDRLAWTIGLRKDRESDCKKMEVIRTPSEEIELRIIYSIEVMQTHIWKKYKKRGTIAKQS